MTPTRQTRTPGRLESALSRLFTKAAVVRTREDLGGGFLRLALSGDALKRVAWTPGQKLQLLLGGWVQRTYTPMTWDADAGSTELLAYTHGDGPGAAWARALAIGDGCAIFGPRASLDLDALERPALFFGDETSLGLAHALRFTAGGASGVQIVLEVTSESASRAALNALGISAAHLIERRPDDAHLPDVQALATELVSAHALEAGVLSGKATSIQMLRKTLRQLGVPRAQIQTKAYWAPGKAGLD